MKRKLSDCKKLKITSDVVTRSWLFLGRVGPTWEKSGTLKSKLYTAMPTIHEKKRLDELNNFCEDFLSRKWVLTCETRAQRLRRRLEKSGRSLEIGERARAFSARKSMFSRLIFVIKCLHKSSSARRDAFSGVSLLLTTLIFTFRCTCVYNRFCQEIFYF